MYEYEKLNKYKNTNTVSFEFAAQGPKLLCPTFTLKVYAFNFKISTSCISFTYKP